MGIDDLPRDEVLRDKLKAAHDAESKRRAAAVEKLQERFRPELKRLAKAIEEGGGPDIDTLSRTIEAAGRHASERSSEFAETLRQAYEPIIERAIESAGIDREMFAKEFIKALGGAEHAAKPGRLLSAGIGSIAETPVEVDVPARRNQPPKSQR